MPLSIPPATLDKFATFGDLLRFLRRRLGLTQMDLATEVGYSDTQISRLEQNLRPPDIPTIEARFVESLGLQDEPETVARLLDLAAHVRREDAPAPGLCPYKGLDFYDEADADLFAGREALTGLLVEQVVALAKGTSQDRFLAVVGASGSGKSSLVRAGLVPTLRWNKASAAWQIQVLTPTAHPLESLASVLAQEGGPVSAITTLMDDLAQDPRTLPVIAKQKVGTKPAARLLLVVDQFEELFALCHSEPERAAFIANLLSASAERDGPVVVVLTLRADFYAHCAGYPRLRQALARHQQYIGAMDDEELRRAIEQAAERGGWDFEPGLVDLLLHDVGHEPGALPLLSHALLETWQRRRGRTMTMSGYASSRGVRGAIAETAEAVFADQFNRAQQAIARRIFLRLTELGDEPSGAGTRRRASISELILRPEEADTTHAVLKALADARLITTSEDSAEVAHEALIREWPKLRGWLEDNREGFRLHRQLTEAAQEWQDGNRAPDALYRGARLAQAREWSASHADELNTLERDFVAASIEAAESELREREAQRQRELESVRKLAETEKQRAEEQARNAGRLRRRAVYLAGVSALALIATLAAGTFSYQANSSLIRSEAQRLAAEARSLKQSAADPQLVALLSLRSIKTQFTIEGDVALTEAAALPLPQRAFIGLTRGTGNSRGIYSVVFSPDGRYVLTGNYDGIARLFDAQTGQELRQFTGHDAGVRAVFSPDGKSIYLSSLDGAAEQRDVETGEIRQSYIGSDTWLTDIKVSPDGNLVLTAGGDGIARLFDASTGAKVCQFVGHSGQLRELAFSPDGQYVATSSLDGSARLWKTENCAPLRVFETVDGLASVDFSPDGKHLATAGWDGPIRLWDVETGEELRQFTGHACYWVSSVRFSPDGRYLLSGSCDRTARLWDVETGLELQTFSGHTDDVLTVAFSPDGRYILTGDLDTTTLMWDLQQMYGERPQFIGHTDSMWSVAYSPDGQFVVTGGAGKSTRLWDARTGQELYTFAPSDVNSVAFSPDGLLLLTGDLHGTAWLWNVQSRELVRRFDHDPSGDNGVLGVAFSPDGRFALTTGQDATIKRWSVETGELLDTFGRVSASAYGIAYSPNGDFVLAGGWGDGVMSLYDAQTGNELRQFTSSTDSIYGVAFSPDGGQALSAGNGRLAILWDLNSGEELLRLAGHTAYLYSVEFSPDGKTALTGSADTTARLWDLATGIELRRFTGHTGPVEWAAFAPDGKTVVTASDDGTARLWDVDYHDTVRYLCSHLLRDFSDDERIQYRITGSEPTCPSS